MVTLGSLVLAIVLSAVVVFVVSALAWMVFPHHKNEWRPLPNEDAVRTALKAQNAAVGQYSVPWAMGGAAARDPAIARKFEEGPVGVVILRQPGRFSMGPMLVQSFVYFLVVSFVIAYLASRSLPAGTEYLRVFQVVGTATWLAYGFGVVQDAIWFGKPWSSVGKHLFDALLYALVTAGIFGWQWPA